MNQSYRWAGGTEQLWREGDAFPRQILILPALFEEANRMRRFTVQLMRRLAAAEIGTLLPDLPGTGESLTELSEVGFDDWRGAIEAVAATLPAPRLTVSIRAGAILERFAAPDFAWWLSPETGARALRDLRRSSLAGAAETFGGDAPSAAFERDLTNADGALIPARCVRMASDGGTADRHIDGPLLWRRAEPGEDDAFVATIADDITAWAATCAPS